MDQTPTSTRRLRAVAGALVVGLLATIAPPALGSNRAAESPELATARERLADARKRAEAAAHEYERAHSTLAEIDEEIAAVQSELPILEVRSDQIRSTVRRRASEMYKRRSAQPFVTALVLDTDTVLTAVRAARLARVTTVRDRADIEELDSLMRAWRQYEGELARRRAQQTAVVEEIAARAAELDRAMADAARAVREIEEAEAVAAFLKAVAAAQDAQEAAQPPPPPPAPPAPRRPAPRPSDDELAELVPVDQLICPIDGPVVFTNDWGNPRPNWRVHQGTDIFAARGTPNVAVADGLLRRRTGGIGGNALWLEAEEGTHYYYAHLESFEGTFDEQGTRRVAQGEVIGYTGSTGNASGGPAHTHFEIHPGGGDAVNPYRMLRVMCSEQLGLEDADDS